MLLQIYHMYTYLQSPYKTYLWEVEFFFNVSLPFLCVSVFLSFTHTHTHIYPYTTHICYKILLGNEF